MSDAALEVDPNYYNKKGLLDKNGGGSSAGISFGASNGLGQVDSSPDLPDYVIRQHNLLGLYLSLNPKDEGDEEVNWGLIRSMRQTLVGFSVLVPLFTAMFLTDGAWLWKACTVSAFTGVSIWVTGLVMRKFPNWEMTIQDKTLQAWPHCVLGVLGLLGLVWLCGITIGGVGLWFTIWLCVTCLLFMIAMEAAVRFGILYFRFWMVADWLPFLQPWKESPAPISPRPQRAWGAMGYAPPKPVTSSSREANASQWNTGGLAGEEDLHASV